MLLKDKTIKKFRLRRSDNITTTTASVMGEIFIPGTQDAAGTRAANLQGRTKEGETDYLFGKEKGKSGQNQSIKKKPKRNAFFQKLDRQRECCRKKAAQ